MSSSSGALPPRSLHIEITAAYRFEPSVVLAYPGQVLVWRLSDGVPAGIEHDVVSDGSVHVRVDPSAPPPAADGGNDDDGETVIEVEGDDGGAASSSGSTRSAASSAGGVGERAETDGLTCLSSHLTHPRSSGAATSLRFRFASRMRRRCGRDCATRSGTRLGAALRRRLTAVRCHARLCC